MRGFNSRKIGAFAAVLATLLLGSMARAATVTYSTTGAPTAFSPIIGPGGSSITFQGVSNVTVPENTALISLGTFTLNATSTTISSFYGAPFVLTITQNSAPSGSAPFTATLSASLKKTSTGNNFQLSFDNSSFYIPNPATGHVYTVNDIAVSPNLASGSTTVQLTGSIATPLPATASAGLALMLVCAGFTGFKYLRGEKLSLMPA
jgi:hypothetical protein